MAFTSWLNKGTLITLEDGSQKAIESIEVDDLIQTFDFDSVGTPNTSTVSIAQGESNLDQDFAYSLSTGGGTTGGNDGGVESESLGDAISKIYVGRKKNSEPTVFSFISLTFAVDCSLFSICALSNSSVSISKV